MGNRWDLLFIFFICKSNCPSLSKVWFHKFLALITCVTPLVLFKDLSLWTPFHRCYVMSEVWPSSLPMPKFFFSFLDSFVLLMSMNMSPQLEISLRNVMVGFDRNFIYPDHLNLVYNFVPMINIPYSNSFSATCINFMDVVGLLSFLNKICVFFYPGNNLIKTPLSSIFWNLGIACDLGKFNKVSLHS